MALTSFKASSFPLPFSPPSPESQTSSLDPCHSSLGTRDQSPWSLSDPRCPGEPPRMDCVSAFSRASRCWLGG